MFFQVLHLVCIRGAEVARLSVVITVQLGWNSVFLAWFIVWKAGVGDCLCGTGFSESVFVFAIAREGCSLTVCAVLPSSWRCDGLTNEN